MYSRNRIKQKNHLNKIMGDLAMAKKKKKGEVMDQFDDLSWIEERVKEVEKEMAGSYDVATDTLLVVRWDGDWEIRLLPILPSQRGDWLKPFGLHWNLIPTSDSEKQLPVGCPQVNFGDYCPICSAIKELVGSRKRPFSDFGMSGNSLAVQKRVLVRGLLVNYTPKSWTDKPPAFDFSNGPLLRIFGLPPGTIGKELTGKLQSPKFGPKVLINPKTGKTINIDRDKNIKMNWQMDLLDVYEIPEEYLDTETWPDMQDFLPKTTTAEIEEVIKKFYREIDADVVNIALSIDAGVEQQQIAEGPTETEKSLKERLDEI